MDFARLGAAFGFLGVALGAFGAHALRSRLDPWAMQVWRTAVEYQLIHAAALLAVGLSARQSGSKMAVTGWAWTAGMVLFSGSLYVLAVTGLRFFGAVTPVGGACLLIGWGCLVLPKKSPRPA